MAPDLVGIRLDGRGPAHRARTLLTVVANLPRAGACILVAPQARIDDGLFDVRVYEDMSQAALATHFVTMKENSAEDDPRIHSWRGRKLVIRSRTPMPVVADTRVVGSTPARFRVLDGALLVIAGRGDALSRPVAESLISAVLKDDTATRPLTTLVEVIGAGETSTPVPGLPARSSERNRGLLPRLSRWIAGHTQ
jgi:hypothetical protein